MKSINRMIFNNVMIFFVVSVFGVMVQTVTYFLEKEEALSRDYIYSIKNTTSVIYKLSDDLTLLTSLYVSSGDKKFREVYSELVEMRHGERPFPTNYFSFLNVRMSSKMAKEDFKEIVVFEDYIDELYDQKYQYESKLFLEIIDLFNNLEEMEMKSIYDFEHGLHDQANENLKSNYYVGTKQKLSNSLDKLENHINTRLSISIDKKKDMKIALRILVFLIVIFLLIFIVNNAYKQHKNIGMYVSRLEQWIEQISEGIYDFNFTDSTIKEFSGIKNKLKLLSEKIESLINKINSQAETDLLTSLPNRRALVNFLTDKTYDLSRYNSKCSVILIDIDKFKSINDNYGHPIGDLVLKNFSDLLRNHTRKSDFISRFGGEEFMIVATNTDINSTFLLANKLREKVENEIVITNEGKELKYTISCGVASLTPELTLSDLYRNSDSALYEAKLSGRNNVKMYSM